MDAPCQRETLWSKAVAAAYYTHLYEAEAMRLKASLAALSIPHQIHAMPELGSWRANAHLRPMFLGAALRTHRGKYVLSLDADAVVHRDPIEYLLGLDCDVACGRLGDELLPGTLWLAPNDAVRRFLARWDRLNERQGGLDDRENFRQALNSSEGLRALSLPPEYCWIFDLSERRYGPRSKGPVIEQLQASREFRNPGEDSAPLRRRRARLAMMEGRR